MQDPNQNSIYNHKKYRITGEVQGVFFRQSTQEKATELGLIGLVQNQPNGDVIVWVKGEPEKIRQLESWLTIGPPRARVSEVLILTLTPEEITQLDNLSDFTITR